MRPRAAPAPAAPKLAAAVAVCGVLFSSYARAQTTATFDVAASAVRYDGFLLSAAGAATPAIHWQSRRATLDARGTYLGFESGNRSLQGSAVASLFVGPPRGWRTEASLAGGASSYADFANFWHLLGEVRLHHVGDVGGMWFAGTGGKSSFNPHLDARPVIAGTAAMWRRYGSTTLLASIGRAFIGDTQYSDIGLTVNAHRGAFVLEGALGGRVWSQGAGRGVYGEGSATALLNRWLAVVVSGGRYPTDPIRGSIAGRYVSAGLRVRFQPKPRRQILESTYSGADGDPVSTAPALRLQRDQPGKHHLIVSAPGATVVEVAGDFTEWRPLRLRQASNGIWTLDVAMTPGLHRLNVRIDNGRWIVPVGTTRVAGDFGDDVGIVAVP